jgi:mandelate racemase/muconate lactonizing enzyme-like protein
VLFLKNERVFIGMSSHLLIKSVAARMVLAPRARPLRTASGDILAAPLVLVDVTTNEGIIGRGYPVVRRLRRAARS